jgi:hypothetical protein
MGPKILSQKMDIGDIRLREVIDVEDNKNQVLSNSNMQASGSYDQNEASGSHDQNEASTMRQSARSTTSG